jgi:Flp pilus assembly protein TadD
MRIAYATLHFDDAFLDQKVAPEVIESVYQQTLEILDAGEMAGGIALLRGLLIRRPDDPRFLYNLGVALSDKGELQEALIHLQRVVQLRLRDPRPRITLGVTLMRSRRLPEAEEEFEKALALAGADEYALGNLASCLRAQNKSLPRAEQLAKQAIQISPGNPAFWITLARTCEAQGKIADAEEAFACALAVDPTGLAAGYARRGRKAVRRAQHAKRR